FVPADGAEPARRAFRSARGSTRRHTGHERPYATHGFGRRTSATAGRRFMADKGDKGAKRAVIPLQLDVDAKHALDELCELRGMTQIAVLSRLVRWFASLDEAIQAAVLDLLS